MGIAHIIIGVNKYLYFIAICFMGEITVLTCAFFGTMNADKMDHSVLRMLNSLISTFIEENGIKTFCTPAQTDFDFYVILSILAFKIKYKDIKVVKILGKKDKDKAQSPGFDYVYLDSNAYKDRCLHAYRLADLIVLDSLDNALYEDIKRDSSEKRKKVTFYDLTELLDIVSCLD